MGKTYVEVIAQIERLKEHAATLREKEIQEVVARIKEDIAAYRLTPEELGLPIASESTGGSRAKLPKFRDSSGNVWSGRGPRPKWFKDALANGVDPKTLLVR